MRIFAFSDWRTQPIDDLYTVLESIEENIDLLLYAGDDVERFVDTTKNHFQKLALTADAELGYVLGNDDSPYNLRHFQIETDRVHDLHRNPIEQQGYFFIGQSGDVGEPAMGYIQYSEQKAKSHLEQLYSESEKNDVVLVSHTPPYGALDFAQRHSQQRIGSQSVREFAEETNPSFILSGHVHQFGGQTKYEKYGPVINVASHDFENSDGRIALIDLPDSSEADNIEVTHTTLRQLAFELEGVTGELESAAALTKLSQVGSKRAKRLQEYGVNTIDEIVVQEKSTLIQECGFPEYHANAIYNHARAYVENDLMIIDSTEYEELQSKNIVLVDIETDLALTRVWCIGAYSYRDDEFEQFVNLDDEEKLIQQFREYLGEQDTPEIVYYAGNSFDEKHLSEAANRHEIQLSSEIGTWTDLCLISRRTIFQPTEGHDLSTIASGLGYEFEHPGISGVAIGSVYSTYLSEGELPEDGWRKYLEYNLDDTLAIKHIIDSIVGDTDSSGIGNPEDRKKYQILDGWRDLPVEISEVSENGSETGETEVQDSGNGLSGTNTHPDPYVVIEGVSPIAHWNEQEPINEEVDPLPQCDRCGELLRDNQYKTFELNEKTSLICEGGCDGRSARKRRQHNVDSTDFEEISKGNQLSFGIESYECGSRPTETKTLTEVECHECGETVLKSVATGKYRINDGETLWYCLSCK